MNLRAAIYQYCCPLCKYGMIKIGEKAPKEVQLSVLDPQLPMVPCARPAYQKKTRKSRGNIKKGLDFLSNCVIFSSSCSNGP